MNLIEMLELTGVVISITPVIKRLLFPSKAQKLERKRRQRKETYLLAMVAANDLAARAFSATSTTKLILLYKYKNFPNHKFDEMVMSLTKEILDKNPSMGIALIESNDFAVEELVWYPKPQSGVYR